MPRDLTPASGTIFAAAFPGTPTGVRDALYKIRSRLIAFRTGEEERFSAELVVAEALNNIVEHALAGLQSPAFCLSMQRMHDGVRIEIRDQGRPMPEDCPPLGEAPTLPVDLEELPEGGFGWFLIRQLARDLEYKRIAGENVLSFRLAIDHAEPA